MEPKKEEISPRGLEPSVGRVSSGGTSVGEVDWLPFWSMVGVSRKPMRTGNRSWSPRLVRRVPARRPKVGGRTVTVIVAGDPDGLCG